VVRSDARPVGGGARSAAPDPGGLRRIVGRASPVLLALASAIVGRPSPVEAHQIGLSQGLYRVVAGDVATGGGESVSVTLTLARGELRSLAREVDQDRDGEVSEVEVMVGATAIEAAIVGGLRISIDERSCTPRFDGASLTEEDGLEIVLHYECPPAVDGPVKSTADEPRAVAKTPGSPILDAAETEPPTPGPRGRLVRADAVPPAPAPSASAPTDETRPTRAPAEAGAGEGEGLAGDGRNGREEAFGRGSWQRDDPSGSPVDAAEKSYGPGELRIDFSALVALGGAHRHIARIIPPGSDGIRAERVLHRLRSRAHISLAPAEAPKPAPTVPEPPELSPDDPDGRADAAKGDPPMAITAEPAPPTPPIDRELAAYFTLGVEHILSGVDHLVFLLGLVIAGGRLRDWALVITAFTVGHSASLALATLQLWTPPPSVIEPLIAASIVYIGLENLFRADPAALRRRWRVTLPFGFVHGFGFAGALAEVGITAGDGAVAWVLALFNLGVEAGQLAALATMALVLRAVPQLSGPLAKRWISAAIALAGLVWLVTRVV